MSDRLSSIRRRDLSALTPTEQARVTAALSVGSVKVARGKSPAAAERRADKVWAEAERRVLAEQAEADRKAQEKADKKARKGGWF